MASIPKSPARLSMGAIWLLMGLLAMACAPAGLDDGGGDFTFPVEHYRVRQAFANPNPLFGGLYHSAEDAYGDAGTQVLAIADGVVRFSGSLEGYGWTIIVDHPEHDVYSLYAHLSTRRDKVLSGTVRRGQVIATLADDDEDGSGNGYPDWPPHLHFGLRWGQMTDYPVGGDDRWSAGYTVAHPAEHGWLAPSEFIPQH